MSGADLTLRRPGFALGAKLARVAWLMVLLICAVAGVGLAMLYSAGHGSWDPWADRQALRFGVCLIGMLAVALVDIRLWLRLAYPIYGVALALLVGVDIMGTIGMGAQRWIDLGVVQLQPSELMKIAMVMALARAFHGPTLAEIGNPLRLVVPAAMVLAPVGLVLVQPDLGTAGMLVLVGAAIFFLAGVRLWQFGLVLAAAAAALPMVWERLHDYQRARILTFLDPASDPLGSGYHISQSLIALASGGLFGKGFLEGTQSHLNFLPERQTDFIFPMLGEEFGLAGGIGLLWLFLMILAYGLVIGLNSRNHFGRLLAIGLTCNLFLYVFINVAMVMGLIPVVGVPLPLISYGGTAMLAVMFGFGLTLSVWIHRDTRLARPGEPGW